MSFFSYHIVMIKTDPDLKMHAPAPFLSNELLTQLQQSKESFEFALEAGHMGTWDIDLRSGTISCSQQLLELWGIRAEEFNGQRSLLQSKVHPEDLQRMNSAINEAILNKSNYELEYRIHPSPGLQRWVMSRGRCTFDPDSNVPARFAGVVYDITDRKQKEELLASSIKARDQFFMVISHELKTPLTCLELQFQVLEWDLKHNYPHEFSPDKISFCLRKKREQLLRLTSIVDNIMDEARISEGGLLIQREEFDLTVMVNQVLERFSVKAESAGVELHFNKSESVIGSWDRFRIEQVLLNLLTNALRYGNKKPIEIEVKKNEDHVMMIVRDQGVGIKEEDQKRIFERFERAISQEEVTGVGLGLFISKNIIESHGGEISLKSAIGEGSEFTVVLPIYFPWK